MKEEEREKATIQNNWIIGEESLKGEIDLELNASSLKEEEKTLKIDLKEGSNNNDNDNHIDSDSLKKEWKEEEEKGIEEDVFLSKSKWRKFWNGVLVHRRILVKILILLIVVFAIIIAFFILTKVGLVEKFLRHVKKLGPLILCIVAIGEVIAGFPIPNLYTLLAIFGGFCFSNGFWKVWLVAWWSSVTGYTVVFLFEGFSPKFSSLFNE
eukprot:TRINITY_DN1899_c0_g1_i4.p1 TRINITY_DN1899_c0_g1~~TRINITY_DN1899_c0_g1_i4.p1  ORF type:complete len:210 (+),score=81.68 TRINITY_DN1899_c0_g1_i4:182-811(+)